MLGRRPHYITTLLVPNLLQRNPSENMMNPPCESIEFYWGFYGNMLLKQMVKIW